MKTGLCMIIHHLFGGLLIIGDQSPGYGIFKGQWAGTAQNTTVCLFAAPTTNQDVADELP